MNAEIIGVGTELLLGQITNTNASKISQALADIGVDVYFHTVVGDNLDRMVATFRRAMHRSDIVIVTGGLGPTPDDITREGIAAACGVELVRDENLVPAIRDVFERLGRDMPEDNLRQADVPAGAVPIPMEGTAPGFVVRTDDALIYSLPGVPWEMEAMLFKVVIPQLRERTGETGVILSREVLVMGLGESRTHEKIADIVDSQSNPTIAYRAGGGQVKVRITAKAGGESEAMGLIKATEDRIRQRLGIDAVPGNHETLAEALGEILRERGATIACAESLTGGLLGSSLTHAGGSSDFYLGSIVAYATEAKAKLLDVDEAILAGPGPVSADAAEALAIGAAQKFGADLGISATGAAGPAPQDDMPVGTVFVGATFGDRTEVRRVQGYGDRENIRAVAASSALDLGRRLVQATD